MERYEHGGDIYSDELVRLDFSVNLNPYGMPQKVKDALRDGIDLFQSYPDPKCRKLCRAIAEHDGIELDSILCGNGADDLIYRLCFALKPKKVLVAAPGFSEYEKAALASGAQVCCHQMTESDNYELTEKVLADIEADTDIVFLCSPNNPTGRLIPMELLEKAVRCCEDVGAYLLLDECFIDFSDGVTATALQTQHTSLLILRAFTKLYAMAGLRLGYIISRDRTLLDKLRAISPCWSVSSPAQTAGIAALKCDNVPGELKELIHSERPRVKAVLEAFGFTVFDSDCGFLMFKAPADLGKKLRRKGFAIRDCSNYIGLGKGYWRIGLKLPEENDMLLDAVREVI